MNFPNRLTVIRVLLIPVLFLTYYSRNPYHYWASAFVFMLAAMTDWWDGYLARRWKQTTHFGAFCDPVADKLIVASALVILVAEYHYWWMTVSAAVIIGREIIVSGLREWMAEVGKRASVAVSFLGKCKTGFQMASIVLLLSAAPDLNNKRVLLGLMLLYLAAFLTLVSMFVYLKKAWPSLWQES
jgi:CDP-diacylglycerol--glycerol-3-phosphate 3-phosphatidyltransferase